MTVGLKVSSVETYSLSERRLYYELTNIEIV